MVQIIKGWHQSQELGPSTVNLWKSHHTSAWRSIRDPYSSPYLGRKKNDCCLTASEGVWDTPNLHVVLLDSKQTRSYSKWMSIGELPPQTGMFGLVLWWRCVWKKTAARDIGHHLGLEGAQKTSARSNKEEANFRFTWLRHWWPLQPRHIPILVWSLRKCHFLFFLNWWDLLLPWK